VRSALFGLPPRQRATLVLRFYCDLSVEQSASALGCSAGTVKSQTAKGIEALRRALDTGTDRPGAARQALRNHGHEEEARHG
jgi:DNA-directed RNA polymerase specialized sigma24 family protein